MAERGDAGLPGLNRAHNPSGPTGRPGAEDNHVPVADRAAGDGIFDLPSGCFQKRLRPPGIQHREGIASSHGTGHSVIQPRLFPFLNDQAGHRALTRSPAGWLVMAPIPGVMPG